MKNIISTIVANNPIPDQTLLPKMWLTWHTKVGENYLECATGDKTTEAPSWFSTGYNYLGWRTRNNDSICVNAGSNIRFVYCKYHENAQLVEFAVVEMSSRRSDGARIWQFAKDGQRYFVDKQKNIYNQNGGFANGVFYAYTDHYANHFIGFIGILHRINYNNKCVNEFTKMSGNRVIVSNGKVIDITHLWHVELWYKAKSAQRTTGKVQKLLDEVTALPHSDLSNACKQYDIVSDGGWGHITDVIFFEKLNDTWSVLRYYYRMKDGFTESYRVYVSEDGECKITKLNDNGEWVPGQNDRGGWRSSYGRIVNFEDMAQCKRLSYIMPQLRKIEQKHQLSRLVSIVRFPEVEQMYKMGYEEIASLLLEDGCVNANLKNNFGKLQPKAKTLLGKVGMNKYQLNLYNQSLVDNSRGRRKCSNGLLTMKHFFGDDLSAIDNDTFTKLYAASCALSDCTWENPVTFLNRLNITDGARFLKNVAKMYSKEPRTTASLIADTIRAHRNIGIAAPQVDWIEVTDSYSALTRMHDALVAIQRAQDEERRARWAMSEAERHKKDDEKCKKIDENRKCYEYEEDGYMIRLPMNIAEIITEGTKQHICIGSYASSHSNGHTNLFFLRQKSQPDAPFYAIEMGNDKQIRQIHGFGNSWLGNHPDAIPTVIRWLRKNGIKCDNKILTCKSRGYCSTNEYVPMPVVD